MSENVKCFYHDDMDGICSAQIVKWKYPSAECFPVDYEKGFPWDIVDKDDLVFMVDYGLQPFDRMVEMNGKCMLTWIDHHKTAIDAHKASGVHIEGIRSMDKAGCELTWEYLFPDEDIPKCVQLLADYDMWRKEDMNVWKYTIEPFEIAMLSYPHEDTDPGGRLWERLHLDKPALISDLIREGETIINFLKKQDVDACKKYAHGVMFDGNYFVALNTPHRGSQQVESAYDPKIHDGICVYRWTGDEYTFSIYSIKAGIDCGAIAKKYGGGGHFGAAGGRWTKEQFAELFYNEKEE